MLQKIDVILAKTEAFVLIVLFSLLIILMSANIIQRNIFGQSAQEVLEYLPNFVMWISLIGASLALRQGQHISMELLLRFVPSHLKVKLLRVSALFGCLTMLVGLYLSRDFMLGELKIFGSKGYLSAIIPIFFASAAFRFLVLSIYPIQHGK